jgi:hypothetical protein
MGGGSHCGNVFPGLWRGPTTSAEAEARRVGETRDRAPWIAVLHIQVYSSNHLAMRCILWPSDLTVNESGRAYGWDGAVTVVAGVHVGDVWDNT